MHSYIQRVFSKRSSYINCVHLDVIELYQCRRSDGICSSSGIGGGGGTISGSGRICGVSGDISNLKKGYTLYVEGFAEMNLEASM
jgi:hypothetical protein